MNPLLKTVSDETIQNYLGIDYADSVVLSNLTRARNTAHAILNGSIGEDYPADDPRIIELALIIIDDLYSTRGYTVASSMSNNMRRLVEDMSWQIKLELQRKKEGGQNE